MEVDISDILADISRPSIPFQSTSTSLYETRRYDPAIAATDHILLTRSWTSERCTPSLLPYPVTLIDRVIDRIRDQITRIEDLTSGTYDSTSYGRGASGQDRPSQQNLNLILSILQTDLSRTQFLVRSYLRCRLAKLTKYATYYSKYHVNGLGSQEQQQEETKTLLLSDSEIQFLQHHNLLLTNLYNSSFLLSLPPSLRRLDDSTGGSARMDEGPDMSAGVLVRGLKSEWNNDGEVYSNGGGTQREEDEKATVELRCERGGVLIARWRDVRAGVEAGELEML